MRFRWTLAPPQPQLAQQLAHELKLSPLLAQCLLNRGLARAPHITNFLEPRLKHLADPFLLPNMRAAVDRLFLARCKQETLVIFGDYDVDGVTSTALLSEAMGRLGWKVVYYLPHRLDEGYGLTREAVENCLKKYPVTLLLAVDCGSTSIDSIDWLQRRGIDVIVLDHHQVSNPIPPAQAIVNPHLPSGSWQNADSANRMAFRELCSVGLAFKLAHALVKEGRTLALPAALGFDLRPLLDLVALGTIADVVPLTGENRILVTSGLERLNATRRPGLVALKSVAQCPPRIGVQEVGYQLGPRLNAAGRLENALEALQLLLARDVSEAMPLAQKLDAQNQERQKLERNITNEVLESLRTSFKPESDFVIVEGQQPWHVGVVGIVASRVLQRFYRPTIIVGGDGNTWRGSGRSIPGFDIAAALRECADLLLRHGGHAMAAGLSIDETNLAPFRQRLNELARRALKSEDLQAPLRLDAEVKLGEITLGCLGALDQLEPIGQGNPSIQFCVRNVSHQRPFQRLGAAKQHVKMWVSNGDVLREAIWFGAGNQAVPEGRFDLAFAPEVNEFNGSRSVQLRVLDWRPTRSNTSLEAS